MRCNLRMCKFENLKMEIQENVSLQPYNTFGIDARAKYFSAFSNTGELEELLNCQLSSVICQLYLLLT